MKVWELHPFGKSLKVYYTKRKEIGFNWFLSIAICSMKEPKKVLSYFKNDFLSKKAFAVVATSETAIYANIIIKKGVVSPPK
jgi:hypothetical protein